jgi:hypothetical protein
MHCSATSLVASLVAGLGVNVGDRLLDADAHNPAGYFEDLDFIALQSRMMLAATPPEDGGHRDWGWTEHEHLHKAAFEAFRETARALAGERAAAARPWGFKNPRTSLALDFWHSLLPDARYLFVYRFPWEVADSMQRLGAEVFLRHPEYAYRIWSFYNRHLLAFLERSPDRCLLVSANGLCADPDRFDRLLRERLGMDVPDGFTRSGIRPGALRSGPGRDPLVQLLAEVRPGCLALLEELDERADLGARGLWGPTPRATWRSGGPGPPTPQLSVIIPCYNHGELLLESVASVERASMEEPLELIVVNDGSDEPWTLEVLAALRRLGYSVVDQENRGLSAARNAGAARAHADLLLPLDADDRLRPDLPREARRIFAAEASVGVVYGDYWEFGLRTGIVRAPEFDLPKLLRGNFVTACSGLRREVWTDCGGWDERLHAWEDWELWIGAAGRGWEFRHFGGIAFDYRRRPDSMVAACARKEVGAPLQEQIVRKHQEIYLRHLPELLIEIQDAWRKDGARELAATAARDLAATATRELAATAEREEGLRADLAKARAALAAVAAERDELAAAQRRTSAEQERLLGERDRLYVELSAWRARVASMEETSAWRFRRWILSLRGR